MAARGLLWLLNQEFTGDINIHTNMCKQIKKQSNIREISICSQCYFYLFKQMLLLHTYICRLYCITVKGLNPGESMLWFE